MVSVQSDRRSMSDTDQLLFVIISCLNLHHYTMDVGENGLGVCNVLLGSEAIA